MVCSIFPAKPHSTPVHASMASNSDDDFVLLICENPNPIGSHLTEKEILVSAPDINSWDSTTILSYQAVKIQANRSRLIEQSSYFHGLLSGSFSESYMDCIWIQWNLESFINLLKFMYGCSMDITFINFLPLFEAALFFGVETLLVKCKNWFSEVISFKGPLAPQIQLDDLIHVWNFSLEHANDLIPELCASYLARNFMWAMSCESFCEVSYSLLLSCLKHPHLTIDSEKHLCDALLVWLNADIERFKCSSISEHDCTDLLKQIRISILPLWYLGGKKKCRFFSKIADESIAVILRLIKRIEDGDFNRLRIRLTEYTKKVDLSDCPQVTSAVLLLSVLPSSYVMDPMWSEKIKLFLTNLQRSDEDQSPMLRELPIMSFKAVQEVDISKCSRLHLEVLIECFCKSFPSLQILKAAYLLNFKAAMLVQLMQKCLLVSEVDLTVDVTPVIPSQVSVLSSTAEVAPQRSTYALNNNHFPLAVATSFHLSGSLLPNITKLTLEGRSDVTDINLNDISELCVSLCYLNLKGCISVTDVGISVLIGKCVKLHSILVCDTTFGRDSVLALCSFIPNCSDAHVERKHLDSLAHQLQMLHMGGCKGVDEESLLKLMSQTHMLKSLCLRDTNLVDRVLYSCLGSSLEMLDLSNTMVSGAAVAHIICGNPRLKCLKARDCKNLSQTEIISEGGKFPLNNSCKELFIELGTSCKLEEIAFGWGLTSFSLEALKPAMASLKAITVGLGGSLGQDSLTLLPATCPLLQSLILYFQVISDNIMINILKSLRHLQVLALCYCLGDVTPLSFKCGMPNLRKLKLERVTPWMTNEDLVNLTQNCTNLIELSLLGCKLLNSDSQQIISRGWPGLISIHLEECGEITANGIASLLDCKALEDLLLRHNGPGIQRNFILDAASTMPMLRKISLDLCDANKGDFKLPNYADRYSLSIVKIARCKSRKCSLDLQIVKARRRPVHKETLVLVWNSRSLDKTMVKERV